MKRLTIPRGFPEILRDPQRLSTDRLEIPGDLRRSPEMLRELRRQRSAEIPRDAGRCPETLRDFRRQRSPETKIPGDPRRSSGISRD